MSRSTRAFTLLEALCMILTLFIFGWICVGVARYTYKHQDDVKGVQGVSQPVPASASVPAPSVPEKKAEAVGSKPAGSPASVPAKP